MPCNTHVTHACHTTRPQPLPNTRARPTSRAASQDDDYFKRLPEPCDDELDMLDLAFGLTET